MTKHRIKLAAFAALLAIGAWSPASWAKLNGIEAAGCGGCHRGGQPPTVTITPDTTTVMPGQKVTLTIAISATNGTAGGFFLSKPTLGTFTAGAGTKLWPDGGLSHTMPGRAVGNQVTFQVVWTAPTTPASGGVDFPVWAISANGNSQSSGDEEGDGFTSIAYGCGAGTKYYGDRDTDGYGMVESGWTMNCAPPMYYATRIGDCNDSDPKMHPGLVEVCDGKDNDCNGMVDENLASSMSCEDKDGDGHGILGGKTSVGCVPNLKGFGLCDGDCDDNDPMIHPGSTEICNGKDDNCDGKIDENARPTCGQGWCRRYGLSCSSNVCTPGQPRVETCNLFDDDCDGVIDNGTDMELCGDPSLTCKEGYCVPAGGSPGTGAGTSTGGDTTGSPATGGATTNGATTGGVSTGVGTSGTAGGATGGQATDSGGGVGCALSAIGQRGGSACGALFFALGWAARRARRRSSSTNRRDPGAAR